MEKGAHVEAIAKEGVRNPKGLAKWQQTEKSCGVNSTSKKTHSRFIGESVNMCRIESGRWLVRRRLETSVTSTRKNKKKS